MTVVKRWTASVGYHDCSTESAFVSRCFCGILLREQVQDFVSFRMASRGVLGVQHDAIDGDVEDALAAGDENQLADDMLIVMEKIASHAHGAV